MSSRQPPVGAWELHISRRVRDRLGLDDALFSTDGRLILVDLHTVRVLAERLGAARDQGVSTGELNALGLLDETLHLLLARYRRQRNPLLMSDAFRRLEQRLGQAAVSDLLSAFLEEFPPTPVYRGEVSVSDYLAGVSTDGVRHVEIVLEELLLLWLTNVNPAATPFTELFDDTPLKARTPYLRAIHELREYLAVQPGFDEEGPSLFEVLRAPAVQQPLSPQRQLEVVQETWAAEVEEQQPAILTSLDILAEENRPHFAPGPGPPVVPDYADLEPEEGEEPEPAQFSIDRAWMPRVVLQAKNAHVWLAQLSQRHGRPIATLDEIPDVELDRLEDQGITALWLIGVWERSPASREIKRRLGDTEAEASAYSLLDYTIAAELGGYDAFDDLQVRAMARGIRLSTDMVPNHVGIDAPWVVEHPEWFLSSAEPPFPVYSFTGPDLSSDERVALYLEDHYWDQTDAAVVFKRVDRASGEVSYIYHGNDGTTMPWNDTAQLDYTSAEVREAVMEAILHVARHSPVIRFDAAMVLTKLHFQRLWFPKPGSGGAIPSRAAHGLSQEAFDRLMPEEFWREVVARVAEEAPETLLLAEAFWLLEGYFVRSLGMHRVYNSAFMNMFRDELNADYRQLIKNTLAFDPRILERFVNFMSNPDERTAIDQFGTDDKYFGVATVMITMPGLPMIAHGQIEGLTEKYGMEFIRPRLAEDPDRRFIAEHGRRLFPLLRRRRRFAAADRFQLFDLVRPGGRVDENVFAYSNRDRDTVSLVVFNNAERRATGRLHGSAPVRRAEEDDPKHLETSDLATALGVTDSAGFVAATDAVDGGVWLIDAADLHRRGLAVDLEPYEVRVLWQLEALVDARPWPAVAERLAGRPAVDLDQAAAELELAAVLDPLAELLAPRRLDRLLEAWAVSPVAALRAWEAELASVLSVAAGHRLDGEPGDRARLARRQLAALLASRDLALAAHDPVSRALTTAFARGQTLLLAVAGAAIGAFGPWGGAGAEAETEAETETEAGAETEVGDGGGGDWFGGWQLGFTLARGLELAGLPWRRARRLAPVVRVMVEECPRWLRGGPWQAPSLVEHIETSAAAAEVVDAITHEGRTWYDRAGLFELLDQLLVAAAVATFGRPDRQRVMTAVLLAGHDLRLAAARSDGSFEGLAEVVGGAEAGTGTEAEAEAETESEAESEAEVGTEAEGEGESGG